MENFKESALVLLSTPIYAIIIGVEIFLSQLQGRTVYTRKGIWENVYLSVLNMIVDIFTRGFSLAILNFFFQYHFISITGGFGYWILLLLAEDFMFYWLHWVDHHCRFFWAIHVTHHSSEEFNLTVGFRSSVFQPLYRVVYFVPLSLLGFKGIDIFLMYSATQIYGILIHTQLIHKLGILEYILITPSHHRVHHASNIEYLDRNLGMVFIFWDRLFGTFTPEEEPVRYGLTQNIPDHHPGTVIFHEWKSMVNDVRVAPSSFCKLRYIFGLPGWSHDGSKRTSKELREVKRPSDKSLMMNHRS